MIMAYAIWQFFLKLTIYIAYFTPQGVELMLFCTLPIFSHSLLIWSLLKIIYWHTYPASYCINNILKYGFIVARIIYTTDVE